MSRPKRTILLIEDEGAISEPLAAALGREGFDVRSVADTAAEGPRAPRQPRRTSSCST